jgi:hypothetical protein
MKVPFVPHRKHRVFITTTKQLMLYGEMLAMRIQALTRYCARTPSLFTDNESGN